MTNLSVAKRVPEAASTSPHALPAWVYNNSDLHRLEFERILKPSWQIVCHINSIPKAGDFETFDLGPESVLVLRDRDGTVRGFHNVCRHRGARLLDGSGNCPATITCPYHGWTYRHDGGLIGMPVRDLTFRVHGLPARGSAMLAGKTFVPVIIGRSRFWPLIAANPAITRTCSTIAAKSAYQTIA